MSNESALNRRDKLLEIFTFSRLTREQAEELYGILVPIWENTKVPYTERLAASILLRTLSHEYDFEEER